MRTVTLPEGEFITVDCVSPLIVDEKRECAAIAIEKNADDATDTHAARAAAVMRFVVQEPGTLAVDVHRPAMQILA